MVIGISRIDKSKAKTYRAALTGLEKNLSWFIFVLPELDTQALIIYAPNKQTPSRCAINTAPQDVYLYSGANHKWFKA